MLVISRKPGEAIVISDNIRITILSTSGDKINIGIDDPKEIRVMRHELVETIEANQASAEKVETGDYRGIAALLKNAKKLAEND